MKKTMMLLLAGQFAVSAFALSSPYTGTPAGSGSYYLYNVESGMWLQNNDRRTDHFTTRAELGVNGFDVEITPEGDGYRLNPRFRGNHSINGSNLYMDTGEAATVWKFEPADGSDVPNAYTISSPTGKLGMGSDGYLSENAAENNTWQFVTREERIAAMSGAALNDPIDVTWLVEGGNFAFNDERYDAWNARFDGGNNPVGGDNRVRCNRAHESWNSNSFDLRQTITGIPNGTYEVSIQGYYRVGGDFATAVATGTENLLAFYFANDERRPLMSTFAGGKDTEDDLHTLGASGKWAPNSLDNASAVFFNGEYKNEPLTVAVTDGTLTVGLTKSEGGNADWSVWDNWHVEYLGTEINQDKVITDLTAALEAAREVAGQGTETINDKLDTAIAEGETLIGSGDQDAMLAATDNLKKLTEVTNQMTRPAEILRRTLALADEEHTETAHPEAVADARTALKEAESVQSLNRALEGLRIARKLAAAERQENVYLGSAAGRGEFYLYNVGQKRFLCGGSDWGTHAALGFPGIPVKANGNRTTFTLLTELYNGTGNTLGFNGYCDSSTSDAWRFTEVSGKERVYYITRSGNMAVGLGFNPYSQTDAGPDTYFYDTVSTSEPVENNENAQWMFITRAERDALLDDATEENPVDASYLINMPGFSQREGGNDAWNGVDGAWTFNAGTIDGRGSRRDDFVFSVAGSDQAFEITQTLTGLPRGKYVVSVQGFYRYGSREALEALIADGEIPLRPALLYANAAETPLADIMDGADKAPGYGWESSAGEIPDDAVSAANYFQHGLYRNSVEVTVGADGILSIGVVKEQSVSDDWVALDNFRLTYLGNPDKGGVGNVNADREEDSPIFTLGGIEVKTPLQPGVYVRAGRKIIIR